MTGRAQRIRGWGFVAPAFLWTVAFFIVPFVVMGAMSLVSLEGRTVVWGISFANYAELAEKAGVAAENAFVTRWKDRLPCFDFEVAIPTD